MITSKFKSPPHYECLKQERLKQIQEDYFPTPKKYRFPLLVPPRPQYIPIALYQPAYVHSFIPSSVFKVELTGKWIGLVISILATILIFWLVFKNNAANDWGFYIFGSACLLLVIYHVLLLFDKRPHLTIDEDGLLFRERNLFIPWVHIIAMHIYIEDKEDSTTDELVVDYIAAKTSTCKTHCFDLRGNKNMGEIVLAINYYQQQHLHGLQNQNNHIGGCDVVGD